MIPQATVTLVSGVLGPKLDGTSLAFDTNKTMVVAVGTKTFTSTNTVVVNVGAVARPAEMLSAAHAQAAPTHMTKNSLAVRILVALSSLCLHS